MFCGTDEECDHEEKNECMLTGKRIRLRAMEPEDLDVLYTLENDDSLWCYGSSNVPYSRYVLRGFIADSRNDIYADGQLRMMMERLTDGAVLGCVDLVNFDARHRRAEVGIVVLGAFQRAGFAKEALTLLMRYADFHLGMRQLYAYVSTTNLAAKSLFAGSGFCEVCVIRDWLCRKADYRDAVFFQRVFVESKDGICPQSDPML